MFQLSCVMTIVAAGRRRIDLHSSDVFVDSCLYVDYRDYLSRKRSFHVSSYGQANECETLNVNARIRMTSPNRTRKRNQSLTLTLSQTTRMR